MECLPFLLASRYCEVDRMTQIAWDLFGNTPPTWERVQAVMDWVHHNVQFGYEFARPTKTAFDVYNERQGVCRDFMHLSITFLRAMNIPARYATGYLGDIGVPPAPFPMDFSAWIEVYLGNRWYTLDARHNEPRIGRILQARARRGGCRPHHVVRPEHPAKIHRLDRRDPLKRSGGASRTVQPVQWRPTDADASSTCRPKSSKELIKTREMCRIMSQSVARPLLAS